MSSLPPSPDSRHLSYASDAPLISRTMSNPVEDATRDDKKTKIDEEPEELVVIRVPSPVSEPSEETAQYRLYKERFIGVFAICISNIIAGLVWPWFGPIANSTATDFGISISEVNWLSNSVQIGTFVCSILVPVVCARIGIRRCFYLGSVLLVTSGWVRYAGTAHSLSHQGSYALLIVAQLMCSVPTAFFLNLAPLYSERFFDSRGRTTATMVMSIANPLGGAIGQVISPLVGTPRQSILVLAIICTAGAPLAFLIRDRPPTPPSFAGAARVSPKPTILAIFGMLKVPEMSADDVSAGSVAKENAHLKSLYMTRRERADFFIITAIFAALVASTNSFSLLSDELLNPYGYTDDMAGFMGGTLLIAGILAAVITAPLFDRVLVHHFALACKVLSPVIALAWLSLVWAVRENNAIALYIIFGIIGVCSLTLLPVALELGTELTRNADTSASILWGTSYITTTIFVLAASPLRASASANPPFNMRHLLIFIACVDVCLVVFIFFLKGTQTRRQMDDALRQQNSDSKA